MSAAKPVDYTSAETVTLLAAVDVGRATESIAKLSAGPGVDATERDKLLWAWWRACGEMAKVFPDLSVEMHRMTVEHAANVARDTEARDEAERLRRTRAESP